MTQTLTTVDRNGNTVKSSDANPFMDSDTRNLMNIPYERTICCARATYLTVTQSRNWLPDAIGGVVWLGYDNPATTPHTPFYCGINEMPESYMVDGRRKFRRDCAWWAFRQVSRLACLKYQSMSVDIAKVWEEIESNAFSNQNEFEAKMVELYKSDPDKVKDMLTSYSKDLANDAVDRYWQLADDLWTKYK
jgi:dipeptidase